jgi:hypothetical protein
VWEIGGLESAGQDLNGVILSCDFGERLRSAVELMSVNAACSSRGSYTIFQPMVASD